MNEAFIQMKGSLNKGVWKIILSDKQEEPKMNLYAGSHDRQKKIMNEINQKESQMSSAFTSFDSLFQNARELKEVSNFLKDSLKIHDESFKDQEIDKILGDMGFVSTIVKE